MPLNDILGKEIIFYFQIENAQGQLPSQQQQQQFDPITYQFQSNFIKEFEIPIKGNEKGLKGLTIDSKNNVWIYHNTNKTSVIVEFNPYNNTFTTYPISKKTNVDNAITNLAGGQLLVDQSRNLLWFSEARTNSLGKLNLTDKKIDLYNIPTNNSGIMGLALSPDDKSIWFAELIGNKIGKFDIESNKITEYYTGESTGPTLLIFDKDGHLWSSLSYSNEILRLEPWMLIPAYEFNGMLKIKLKHQDIYSPFGLSILYNYNNDKKNNDTSDDDNNHNTVFVSDHGSSRIIAIPIYDQNILNEVIQDYTSYWTSHSKNLPNTLPSQIVSDNDGNVYFAEHGGNRIAKFSTHTKTMTEYEIPTGPLSTTVFVALSNDDTRLWFTEWESNKIGYLDITQKIPFSISVSNKSLDKQPIFFNNNTQYKTEISLTRNNNLTLDYEGNLSLNNLNLSVYGMSDKGPKEVIYSFNPEIIDLTKNDKGKSLLTLEWIKDDQIRSENNTLMISATIMDKNNLTTSVSEALPISIIKTSYSNDNSVSSSPSSEQQTANYRGNNIIKESNSLENNLIDIIQNLSLTIAIILIGYILYKKIKSRKSISKEDDYL